MATDNYTQAGTAYGPDAGMKKSAKDEGGRVMSDRVTPRVADATGTAADVSVTNPMPVNVKESSSAEMYLRAIMIELREMRNMQADNLGFPKTNFEPLPL